MKKKIYYLASVISYWILLTICELSVTPNKNIILKLMFIKKYRHGLINLINLINTYLIFFANLIDFH